MKNSKCINVKGLLCKFIALLLLFITVILQVSCSEYQKPVNSDSKFESMSGSSCNFNKKVPVILVPGAMGSYSKKVPYRVWPYPRLSQTPPAWDSDELVAFDPYGYVGWIDIIYEFKTLGYIEGCNLFIVPYDWSLSIPDISKKYLVPWINHAKRVAGSDKVDIIAHSMGGLVSRSYIQSENYVGDVRKFAMVATPNKGAAGAYYMWESGDPITLDEVPGVPSIFNPTAYFYTNTLAYFHQDRLDDSICKFDDAKRYKPLYCDKNKIYDRLHKKGLSIGQILSIDSDALVKNGNIHKNIPIKKEENTFLKALNNLPCLNPKGCVNSKSEPYRYKHPKHIFTSDKSGVQTMLFRGLGTNTVASIIVDPQPKDYKGKLNKDGIPRGFISTTQGDGSVLAENVDISGYLKPGVRLEIKEANCDHQGLIEKFIPELVEFVTEAPIRY